MAIVEQLAAQGAQLIADITPTLSKLIELTPGNGSTWLQSVPQVRLVFFSQRHGSPRMWTPTDFTAILCAFAQLACHSQRLNAFPGLKTQFWIDVLQSDMGPPYSLNVHKSEFLRASFPEFVVDFTVFESLGHDRDGAFNGEDGLIGQLLEDALVEFMTTPVPNSLIPSLQPQPLPSFGLVFNKCCLRVSSLERLERFLDRTLANRKRHYALRMLEVSHDCLTVPELDILARIVRKSVNELGLEELQLDSLTTGLRVSTRPDWSGHRSTPEPMLDIARTVFGLDAQPIIASRKPSDAERRPQLRRLSMSANVLSPELFATRFSALRYGCTLQEDTTTYSVVTNSGASDDCYVCWRWIAFGLFYPLPTRFAKRFRLRNLGHFEHNPLLVEIIAKILRNPAAELIFGGKKEVAPATELLVCVVQAGASVEIFQTGKKTTPEWTDTIADLCELEAIYEREDGAVCVVVPGVGLGWVQAESIVRIEREPLSSARSKQDGLYAINLGLGMKWRAETASWWTDKQCEESRQSFLETVGTQIFSLDIGSVQITPGFLPVVLQYCTKLTQLSLGDRYVPKGDGNSLLDALDGALGHRLQVLIFNDFVKETKTCFQRLFALLHDVENRLALREIRCGGRYMTLGHLTSLYSALQTNTKLSVVAIDDRQLSWGRTNKVTDMKERLNADFHGQLLRSALSIDVKLAFLSVVTWKHHRLPDDSNTLGSTLQALDSWLIQMIFAFASSHEIRRTIGWSDGIRRSNW